MGYTLDLFLNLKIQVLDAHVDHVFKCLVQVVADLLDLIFLSEQVLLNLTNN